MSATRWVQNKSTEGANAGLGECVQAVHMRMIGKELRILRQRNEPVEVDYPAELYSKVRPVRLVIGGRLVGRLTLILFV